MNDDRHKNEEPSYREDAVLVIYEDDDEENYEDADQARICIYDTRIQAYWRLPGIIVDGIHELWGEIVAKAFYGGTNDTSLGEPTKGHPFDDPSCDISALSLLAWVTTSMGKYHRDEVGPWPTFHINMPCAADAIGRKFLAGIIMGATTEKYYTPWHVCYNWETDEGFHRPDCAEK